MIELGLANVIPESPPKDIKNPLMMQNFAETMLNRDVHLYYGRPNDALIRRIAAVNKMKPARGGVYNEVRYPPTLVFSLDDNYNEVSPFNESFILNGYKLPDGTPINEDDSVKCQLTDGTIVTLWKEGAIYGGEKFDAARNRQGIEQMNRIFREDLAGSFYSTPRLMEYYRDEIKVKNPYYYPNSVLFPEYSQLKDYGVIRKDPSRIKVLWQGGSSHYEDWFSLRDPIMEVSKRFPEVDWVIWGAKFNWIHDAIPPERVTFVPWMPYEAYKLILQVLDFDFVVAPLTKSKFNEGKSCIKFYEPAALNDPKPTLAASVAPYSDEIIHGQTGLLYDGPEDFVEQFGKLVASASLRRELATNANTWLHENRDAMDTAVGLYEWLVQTREEGKKTGNPGLQDLLDLAVR
jgi:hypothetical protein